MQLKVGKKRAKRVNYNNMFVIFEYPKTLKMTDENYKKFKSIKYTNKRMITNPIDFEDEKLIKSDLFDSKYHPGQIMKYKSKISKKRFLDDCFDYVAFLNNKQE